MANIKTAANYALSKAKHIDWGELLLKSVIGVFLVAFVAQVAGGYVVNRIEENRQKNKKQAA